MTLNVKTQSVNSKGSKMEVLRMNEDYFKIQLNNWINGTLNLPGFFASDVTLIFRLLALSSALMVLCLLGMVICGSVLLMMGTTFGFRNSHLDTRVHVMAIAGSGGHTSEVLRLMSGLEANRYYPRSYVIAETDSSSESKIVAFESASSASERANADAAAFPGGNVNESRGSYRILKIPRSREVGQSWISTAFTSVFSLFHSIPLIVQSHPDLVICNGPGTCIPVCLMVRFIRLFRIIETKIIFVESICRVKSLSLSGKILYHLKVADRLVVQWPELEALYPRTQLLERIV